MLETRQRQIIESAIKLFAKKGFHFTSIQDIVDDCGISKGGFYNYFSAKEELHFAIFQYYFDKISRHFTTIKNQFETPQDKFKEWIRFQFEQTKENREFFVIYLREQSFSINDELRVLIEKTKTETLLEIEAILKDMYGNAVTPFLGDITLLVESMTNTYIVAMLFHNVKINIDHLPQFILSRTDDIVQAFNNGEQPIIKTSNLLYEFSPDLFDTVDAREKVVSLLNEMEEILNTLHFPTVEKKNVFDVLQLLHDELNKKQSNQLVIEGLLASLKAITEFDLYRKKIARFMNIQLL